MRTTAALSFTFLLVLGAGACTSGKGDDDDVGAGGAKLTIVGEESLRLENGWETELTVRYTDLDGQPLAGDVEIVLQGDVAGAFLDRELASTDADGKATVTLTAGSAGDAHFAVEASAADADPVQWDVDVLAKVMDMTGMYRLDSQFDLASGIPGTAGTVINTFIDMTDDPYDPATWLLDKVQESIDNGVINDLLDTARPGLDALLKELLVQLSPDIVDQIIEVGDAFGQIARHFGTASTLEVTETSDVDHPLAAQHTLTDLVFTIDGADYDYPMTDLGMTNPSAATTLSYNATRFTLGDHEFPLSYGSILLVALDQLILPMIDPNASDLASFLTDLIDCAAVGQAIADEIGFGSASLYEGGCTLGLGAAADYIEGLILSLDQSAMVLGIHGDVRWMDTNHDYEVDVLQNGAWEGQVSYAGTPAPLGPSTFRGERMSAPD